MVSKMDAIVEETGFDLVFNFFGLLLLSLAIDDKIPNPPEDDFFLVPVLAELFTSFLKSTGKNDKRLCFIINSNLRHMEAFSELVT